MMNKLKNLSILFLSLVMFNCDSDEGTDFANDINTGWVEFNTASTSVLLSNSTGIVDIPFKFNVPVSKRNTTISYEIEQVCGTTDINSIINTTSTIVPAETFGIGVNADPNLSLDITGALNADSTLIFDVILTQTNNSAIKVGLPGSERITRHRVTLDAKATTYSGDAYSTDLGQTSGAQPAFTVDFIPTSGVENSWDLVTIWGPDFVTTLCGGCVPAGSFPYPGSLILDPTDNTVTIEGADFYTEGGTGTYDPCTDTFTLNILQSLFGGDFTVDVVLTGN
jgi:hypothetical protein